MTKAMYYAMQSSNFNKILFLAIDYWIFPFLYFALDSHQ